MFWLFYRSLHQKWSCTTCRWLQVMYCTWTMMGICGIHHRADFTEWWSSSVFRCNIYLFTNVAISLAVEVAHKCLQNEDTLEKRTVLNIEEIATLHKFCLDSIYICFRGKYYEQIFDTTMGSPVSVVVANLVIEEIEQTALSKFHSMPRLWKRYECAPIDYLARGITLFNVLT